MTPTSPDYVLLGVDGGATEVKVHEVHCDSLYQPTSFVLGDKTASRVYPRLADFAPVPVQQQLAEREAEQATPAEDKQGDLWIAAAADAIAEVAQACGSLPVIAGMGMPGLKTADGRGISALNNGPRMPQYLAKLETYLDERGVTLRAPMACLGSDADYCGLGEEWAGAGKFRDVDNAYYVGCGTGVADAMKLDGRLVTFDEAKPWLQKAWQIPSAGGATYEKLVSARNMNAGYAESIGLPPDGASAFPEQDALAGKPEAVVWMAKVAEHLAALIVERIDTIKNGRRAVESRGTAYLALATDHPYRGTILDRVVIGQRMGQIYMDERYREVFGEKLERAVAGQVAALDDADLAARYLDGDTLKPGLLCASSLRAAPALGAAVAAVQALSQPAR